MLVSAREWVMASASPRSCTVWVLATARTFMPAARAAQTLEAAIKRESFEGEKRARLASGVLGLDMYKMREPLAAAGLKYID